MTNYNQGRFSHGGHGRQRSPPHGGTSCVAVRLAFLVRWRTPTETGTGG